MKMDKKLKEFVQEFVEESTLLKTEPLTEN